MSITDDLLNALEKKIENLLITNGLLHEDIDELKKDLERAKMTSNKRLKDIKRLEEINNELRVTNAMLGSPEHKRLMKNRINQIIKEVDSCIATVKQTTL